MTAILAEGAPVRIKDRAQVPADIKSQMFFEHYRNLAGTIGKVYADGTATIHIDSSALPKEIAERHTKISQGQRQRMLDNLSDEARNKMTAAEKVYNLRYTVLVNQSDLEAAGPATPVLAAATPAPQPAAVDPPRKTLADIEAEEARHIEEILKKGKQ
ncbi:MAG: hypothetical protein ACLQVD_10375 [Capsulimonadaceae bacterium]